jgi:hypothetical protein
LGDLVLVYITHTSTRAKPRWSKQQSWPSSSAKSPRTSWAHGPRERAGGCLCNVKLVGCIIRYLYTVASFLGISWACEIPLEGSRIVQGLGKRQGKRSRTFDVLRGVRARTSLPVPSLLVLQ